MLLHFAQASVKGLRFAYDPPPVKMWNGTSVVLADSKDFTEDYKCLQEGSEVLVRVPLGWLIRHVAQIE